MFKRISSVKEMTTVKDENSLSKPIPLQENEDYKVSNFSKYLKRLNNSIIV